MVRRFLIASVVAAALGLPTAGTAMAHQHLGNPSGTCPAAGSNVPQGTANPAGNTPGGRNNAAGNEQGTAHCNQQ